MYIKLQEIATIIAGYAFRGAITPDPSGHLLVLQAKDLVQGQPVTDVRILTRSSHEVMGYAGQLKTNDVLLVARGMRAGAFRSTVFASAAQNVIASASVHIIRTHDVRVLPAFISLYLNSKYGQDAIAQILTASYVGAIPRKQLERIKIPLPSLAEQQLFIDLDSNIQEQARITDRQNAIKRELFQATLSNLLTS